MATIIEMPKLSDTMSEGKILQWRKKEGDPVSAGEVLAEIESDKANMEMEAYDSGYLRKLLVPEGGSVPVGAPIAIVTEAPDEEIPGELVQAGKAEPAASVARRAGDGPVPSEGRPATAAAVVAAPGRAPVPEEGDGRRRLLASPLAFRMAAELGLNLRDIRGSGPDGRVVKRDIEAAAGRAPKAPAAGAPPATHLEAAPPPLAGREFEDVPLSSMRRAIAGRLVESKNAAPHYYVTMEVDMAAAVEAKEQLNRVAGAGITYNDLVVKAAALALARHPQVNASWQGDFVRLHRSVDIGVAVAIADGLITPVVRGCHHKSLGAISREIQSLAERAKAKKLSPDEYRGATFTISNLGMYGVKQFTAIINPPAACILAVSAIQEVPVVEDGAVVPGKRMALTLSSDHRLIDGAQAAQFLRDLKQLLENPLALAL